MLLIFIQQDSQLSVFSIKDKILLVYDLDNKNMEMNHSKVGNTDMYHYICNLDVSYLPRESFGVCEKGI